MKLTPYMFFSWRLNPSPRPGFLGFPMRLLPLEVSQLAMHRTASHVVQTALTYSEAEGRAKILQARPSRAWGAGRSRMGSLG